MIPVEETVTGEQRDEETTGKENDEHIEVRLGLELNGAVYGHGSSMSMKSTIAPRIKTFISNDMIVLKY